MKKNFKYALLSAIALVGAVSFSACSSNEEVVDNPNYDSEKNAVKTQFTISLPQNLKSQTRQAYDVVQEGQAITDFRGMSDIVLIPFFNATDRTSRFGDQITLGAGNLLAPSASNDANSIPSGKLLTNSNAVLYKDVTIPVGTSGFLFYGKATGTDGFANGSLTPAGLAGETSGITFTPTPILTAEPVMTKGDALATYVSSIAAAKDASDASITWAGCADPSNASQSWYSAILGQLYTNFISMKAGGSSYVQAAVQDLYSSVYKNTDKVSLAITAAIKNAAYASDASTSGTLTFTDDISGYPANNNMPDGAAALSWSTATPAVASAVASSNFGHQVSSPATPMNIVNMSDIVYPASLYYFVDSSIKTSNSSRKDDYDGTNDWNTILATYTTGTEVSPATRSVAIVNPIQYGVGRLDVKVRKLDATAYYDKKGDVVQIPTGGFQLTGVLIGGQKAVDYKFNPITTTGAKEYTIYDNTINTAGASGSTVSANVTTTQDAGPNYTMALETAPNEKVYVALEFLNTSTEDFQGFDGIVKAGCKFYLIAQLDPSANVEGSVSGVTTTLNMVFKQDYKTTVTFTIGAGSADENGDGESDTPGGFANAYTTIPDLRTPQLELGFSVNLEWQPGIEFDVTL